ncbi:MAG: hypothetical protein KDA58_06675 [Planctomycetaceae bacterium]|nr:hypothetical protein [Planctomycetaceae bacterium]
MFGQVQETQYDLRFSLLRIPVRVHPTFWFVGLLIGSNFLNAGIEYLLGWILVFFVSILVHEMGHALVARYFGYPVQIILYGLGGLASYLPAGRYNRGQSLAITFAGPGAGFLLAGLTFIGGLFLIPLADGLPGTISAVLKALWTTTVIVNVFWSGVNLLPVLPLDGGSICRDVLTYVSPHRGQLWTHWTGVVVGVIAGAIFFQIRAPFAGVMFLLLAVRNFMILQGNRF